VLATLLLVGCGVSSQQQATRIEPDDVPFGLLEDQPTTTVIQAGRDVTVYLRSADRLVPVQRSVNSDAGLDELLSQVITGPTEIEESLGVTTAVPSGTIGSVETAGGTAAVDLADSFGDIRSRDQIFALGQIVYTLTGQPGIGSVRFTVDGEDVIVPLSDGRQSDDPLSRDDFDAIAPK
jgi:spore germination protein GerM